ncbi:hypothetical protein [Roseivirga sp.]|uniref:hypothetical protein n=1 Tax=Roseivirga sp. TaxID=1964215 RepID=UPI003B8CFE4E
MDQGLSRALIFEYNSVWGQITGDGTLFNYKMRAIWSPFFQLFGLCTEFSIGFNSIIDYKEIEGYFGSSIVLSIHKHKLNNRLNLVHTKPLWIYNKGLKKLLIKSIEDLIVTSKRGKNIALICVSQENINEYYAADGLRPEGRLIDLAKYQLRKQKLRAYELSMNSTQNTI